MMDYICSKMSRMSEYLFTYMCNGGRELDNKHHLRFITLNSDSHPTCGLLPVGFIYINMVVGLPTIT